jgi:excisionase family DNA binding protein
MLPTNNPEPLAFAVKELPTVIAVGRSTISTLIKSGALPSRRIGTRVIVLREDVERYLRSLPIHEVAA